MKAAFDTSLLRSLPVGEALREISNAGFKYVEIGLAHFSLVESTDEDSQILLNSLKSCGLEIAAVIGNYPLSYPDEEVRAYAVQQYLKAFERAETVGCKLFASELNGDIDDRAGSERAFLKSFREIRSRLERSEIVLCFEAHPGDFIESNKLAVELISGIDSPNLRYLYCAPHSFILGQDIREMLEYCREILAYVHLCDSLRPQKTFFSGRYFPKVQPHQHLLPGSGDVDLRTVLSTLKGLNYEGFVTMNPFSHFDKPLDALRASKKWLDSELSFD